MLIFILLSSCRSTPEKKMNENIPVLNFEQLEPYLNKESDSTYVVNFWATWCKPCVKEMPAFLKLDSLYRDQKVKVLLVSLDFPENIESQVKPFIRENNVHAEVVLLDDPNANAWINKVDSSWSGAIPATVIYNSKGRDFYERTFEFEELEEIIKSKI
ncbi:MAG: TlpA family protein disulfide reductase [Bacteroidales bacterium]|nr:TlpA family protein disulfide reductase [Bacteroidales bacterium]MCF8344817.1 TlpA family protein disulfide reductase [Bacteroidales bacterium]MCF8352387.1 TlpA family protein disulfide reductase [Bacteroidales bacterium]MCF8376022.1 TlpA family protein disulfide reductase [Bacteroidales bacterium]MCF8402181.1 TlpA family protein disulfide reductase [Bacteroidales bacterium]